MTLFRNKYRIESIRLKNWDYSWDGYYFITIYTKNRKHFFGEILNGEMILSDAGKFAEKYWREIPKQFSYATLDEYVIMPDHMHGILVVNKAAINRGSSGKINRGSSENINPISTITMDQKSPTTINKKSKTGGICKEYNPMLHNNVSRIIRWYKGRTTFESRQSNPDFSWQSLFYDHIIRNETSLFYIRRYIKNNPIRWHRDKNNISYDI